MIRTLALACALSASLSNLTVSQRCSCQGRLLHPSAHDADSFHASMTQQQIPYEANNVVSEAETARCRVQDASTVASVCQQIGSAGPVSYCLCRFKTVQILLHRIYHIDCGLSHRHNSNHDAVTCKLKVVKPANGRWN